MADESGQRRKKILACARAHSQLSLSILGVIFGIIFGYVGGVAYPGDDVAILISVPGEILLRMYKMLTLPLVLSSVVSALARVQLRTTGRMFVYMILYYLVTTFVAALIGIIMVAIFNPGNRILMTDAKPVPVSGLDTFLDFFRNMFPENLIQACFQLHRTIKVTVPPKFAPINSTAEAINSTAEDQSTMERKLQYADGLNIFGLVVFCSVFGLFSGYMGQEAEIMVQFFTVINVILMKIARLIMWYFPIGAVFLITSAMMRSDEVGAYASDIGLYIATVSIGLIIHAVIFLPGLYYFIVRKNPLIFAKNIIHAFVTGFGTSDSVATLPVTYVCLERNQNLDKRVTRFVTPIASAFNLDGTALYAGIATIFLANLSGISLNFGQYLVVGIVSALCSFANRGIPNAGVITMALVLKSAGIGSSHLGLLLSVDWLMNRCRTAVNVWSQSVAVAIVHHYVENELDKTDKTGMDWNGMENGSGKGNFSPIDLNEEEKADTSV